MCEQCRAIALMITCLICCTSSTTASALLCVRRSRVKLASCLSFLSFCCTLRFRFNAGGIPRLRRRPWTAFIGWGRCECIANTNSAVILPAVCIFSLLTYIFSLPANVQKTTQTTRARPPQHRPIRVVRFIIAGSIEERIVALQRKKQLVFDGTVGRDMAALARLTEEDLRFLFS